MTSTIIKVFFDFFIGFVNLVFGPVFTLIDNLISALGLSNYIILFNDILTYYVGPLCGFFFQFMGPITITIIMLEIQTTIAFYTISMSITWGLKAMKLIKKLPMA